MRNCIDRAFTWNIFFNKGLGQKNAFIEADVVCLNDPCDCLGLRHWLFGTRVWRPKAMNTPCSNDVTLGKEAKR